MKSPFSTLLFVAANLFALPTAALHATELPSSTSKQVPVWAYDAVWYQIFPERFRNGDPKNDPIRDSLETPVMAGDDWRISSWTADWFSRDGWEKALGSDFYKGGVFERRYGGDLQGVLDKLDYLNSLGINALYFNPLFYARSMHKYDGSSYHHIDPYFGPDPQGDLAAFDRETNDPATWKWTAADKLFLKVIKEAHARGMKVIIDGVFNHTGRDFFAFKDLRDKQSASPYKEWYVVNSFDNPDTIRNEFDYKGWWGYKSLPVFASAKNGKDIAPGPKKYIFDSTRRWMDPESTGDTTNGVDGWRLDAADERPNEFWAEWNAYVRKINPQAYTSAEIWKDPKAMIVEGGFSAVMNYYGFAIPVKGWLADNHLTPSRFAKLLDDRRNALPREDAYAMQNLMDSHDTDRLPSMIINGETTKYKSADQIDYNGNNDLREAPNYLIRKPNERERKIQRLVVLMQMAYVGAPMVYYGDEAGMWGAHDPDDRQAMVWDDLKYAPQTIDPRNGKSQPPQAVGFDKDLFQFYHDAMTLRRSHPALNRGDYTLLGTDDKADTFTFARRGADESLIVAFNRSDAAQVVTVQVDPELAHALSGKPRVVFATAADSSFDVQLSGDALTVHLPPLVGLVVGAP